MTGPHHLLGYSGKSRAEHSKPEDKLATREVACTRKRVTARVPRTVLVPLSSPLPSCTRIDSTKVGQYYNTRPIEWNRYHGAVFDTRDYMCSVAFRHALDTKATRGIVCHLALDVFRCLFPIRLNPSFLSLRCGMFSPYRSPHKPTRTSFQ